MRLHPEETEAAPRRDVSAAEWATGCAIVALTDGDGQEPESC